MKGDVSAAFKRGNAKLGQGVWTWGIPSKSTCPGRSSICQKVCYARKLEVAYPTVWRATRKNLQVAKSRHFAAWAALELKRLDVKVLRLSVNGDFFSVRYAAQWLRVFAALPDTRFFTYTRSWRKPGFGPVFAKMAALPNVSLWYSADAETGYPRRLPPNVRVAWLVAAPGEEPDPRAALVFRTHAVRAAKARALAGVPVCPTETGYADAAAVTCASCRTCMTPPAAPPGARPAGRHPLPVVN